MLPTIISRCQVHDFNRITSEDIAAHLQYIAGQEGIEADPEALFYIAMSADGGMRDALSMFDQIASFGNGKVTTEGVRENLNLLADDDYFALLAHILQGNHHKTLTLIDGLLARGYEGNNIIRGFSGFLRNVLLAQTPDTLPLVEVPARTKERMVKAGQYAPSNLLWEYLKISTATGSKYTSAAERRLALEMSLLQMCEKSPQSPLRTPPDPAPTPTQGTSTPPQPDRQPPQSNNTTRQTIASAPAPTTPQPEVTAPRSSNNAINKYGFNMLEGRSTADLVAEGAPTQQPLSPPKNGIPP